MGRKLFLKRSLTTPAELQSSRSNPVSLTRQQVREYDRRVIANGVPGIRLMHHAARGATDILLSLGVRSPIAIVCGKGNNGGDGFLMAKLLHEAGSEVWVELVADPAELTGDAKIAFQEMLDADIIPNVFQVKRKDRLAHADWIVDAILGTGAQGEIRSPFREAIEAVNEAGRPVFAVDIPSGLDCDSGLALGPAIKAKATATFVDRKTGFDNPNSKEFTGDVTVVDIGGGSIKQVLEL